MSRSDAMATARGHLERTPANQPHTASQAVSALKRLHAEQHVISKSSTLFDPTTVARSQTLHMDYTGRLQTICIWSDFFDRIFDRIFWSDLFWSDLFWSDIWSDILSHVFDPLFLIQYFEPFFLIRFFWSDILATKSLTYGENVPAKKNAVC